jgi:hypothetical protein
MTRFLAALMLAAAAAVAIAGGIPDQVIKADKNHNERREAVSRSTVTGLSTFVGQTLAIGARSIEREISKEWAKARGLAAGGRS